MNHSSNRKETSLGKKLKGVLTDLSVDIFGYEHKASQNIINHTQYISKKINLPTECLSVQIFRKNRIIRAFLCNKNKPICAISMTELAHFFMDTGAVSLINAKEKIPVSINSYIEEFSSLNSLDAEGVAIWISTRNKKVKIIATYYNDFFKEISLTSLIKYFK